jgi:hypothetical protein
MDSRSHIYDGTVYVRLLFAKKTKNLLNRHYLFHTFYELPNTLRRNYYR